MPATPPHQDKSFRHGVHIFAMVITLGWWTPVWMWRQTLHKIDRNREAMFEIGQQIDALAARRE